MNIFTNINQYTAKFLGGLAMFSMLLSALPVHFSVAEAASPVVLFQDDFDDFSKWTAPGINNWVIAPAEAGSNGPTLRAVFDGGLGQIESDSFSTLGYENVQIDYRYKGNLSGAWSAEFITFSYQVGAGTPASASWNLNNAGNNTWENQLFPGSAMDNQAGVTLRLSGLLDSGTQFDIDSIVVTGELIATACTPQHDVAGPTAIQNTDTSEYFTTIQDAIDDCDTVNTHTITVAAGTYNENVVVNKEVSITGAGKDAAGTLVTGSAGPAFKISSDNVTITGVSATAPSSYSFEVKPGIVSNLTLDEVKASGSSVGLKVDSNTSIDGLTVSSSNFDDNNEGWSFAAASSGGTTVDNVIAVDTTFNNNTKKGVYAEKLNNAHFDNITVDGSGNNGAADGSGFNINLKYGDYANISLTNSTINNSGVALGTGIHITARDDGSYATIPATLTGVTLENNVITNNSVGLRFGEPGKGNYTPTLVHVNNNDIVGNSVIGLDNQTNVGDLDAEGNWWGDVTGPSGEGLGSGDVVNPFVTFEPWLCGPFATSPDSSVGGSCNFTPKTTETVIVSGDTFNLTSGNGWLFNRDLANATPIEFNLDESVIGSGALYVKPISSTVGARKFIGEYFWLGAMADLDGFSYDFKIGAGGADSDSEEFYLNVYANFGGTPITNYYDCKYNVVPSNGTTGAFATATFDPTATFAASDVITRGTSPHTCPATPADMDTLSPGSTVRAFAINTGDTVLTDAGLDGYFDNVVLDTKTKVTTFDFEPIPDVTDPTVTVKDGAITCEAGYEEVSFKLKDLESGIDKIVLNGVVKELSNSAYSDLNGVKPGTFGAVEGINTLEVYDVAGNISTLVFTLCGNPSTAPTATIKEGSEFTMTCDAGYSMLSYKLHDADMIDRVVINGVVKDLTDNKWSDVNFLKPGVFGAVAGENTMIVYDVDGNNSTYTFFLCGEVVKSTVTMCKVDEQENSLSGWQLALVGQEVDTLAFEPTAAVQSMTAIPAGSYVLKAEGTYNYGNGNRFADARFSERRVTEANYTGPYVPWVLASASSQGLAIQVGGDSTVWGNIYSPSHVYYSSLTQAALGDIDFSMYDNAYADNQGTIDLTLFNGFTGVTGEDGCVTFTDVPYGSYNVEELMQTGFTNTSGLVSVEVDEETETFTVVNNDLSYVPPCEMTAYSDEGTVVVENNDYAKLAYTHNNWTANIPGAEWIWETYQVINPTVDTIKTFEETFTVTDPTSAVLDIGADNSYRVFVNGIMVVDRSGQDKNFLLASQRTFTTEILDELVSGENTLRIEVTNIGVSGSNNKRNPAGLLYKLVVNGASDCEVTTETEPVVVDPEPEAMFEISGFKYEVTDSANVAVAGWTINVTDGDYSTTTTTEADGSYSFMLPAGDWTVSEEMQTGWLQSSVHENGSIVIDDEGLETCNVNLNVEGLSTNTCDFYNQQEVETIEDVEPTTSRSSNGGTLVRLPSAPEGQVLGASTTSMCPFLLEFMQMGVENTPLEVTKLQMFLNIFKSVYGGVDNPVTGVFGPITDSNVKTFQAHFKSEILDPWYNLGIVPHNRPTGFVYKTTLWKINSIVCPDVAETPSLEGEDLTKNTAIN